MICLGIESTAHTFGVGIIDENGRVLANVIKAFTTEKGGIIPGEAAQHHADVCANAITEALQESGLSIRETGLIAFSQGPGIGHCLKIGATAARTLSLKNKLPIIGVNHCIAHLEIGRLMTAAKDPVLLYVSGANTQVISYEAGKYRIIGETLDIGTGNFLDVFARHIGLGFPGGPKIEELAAKGNNYIKLPYTVKGMDVSLGGLLTNLKRKSDAGLKKEDLCFSLQETAFAMLIEISERALAHCGKDELLLGGGVACNKRLQEMAERMCEERNAKLFVPKDRKVLVDNGLMIAWLGILMHKSGRKMSIEETDIKPYQRTDHVEVTWR
ncbi:bifunctional N(6)-L-threonylcarbamoyladenine synthase/serine/threonine protein kinase [Candidatus Woesearchaeota archaeon]|nr:bifunctional N(6)-L-threonylcarbamoyladenine synthase/serine/threonine protein kinase [Candidatus Woesearchaeota archaeon]